VGIASSFGLYKILKLAGEAQNTITEGRRSSGRLELGYYVQSMAQLKTK
jgi:hypothetical protein